MYFKLRKDTRAWFRDIKMNLDFDMYYLCLMAGFAAGRPDIAGGQEDTDLVDYFPGSYRSRGRLLVGLLIREELKRFKIRLDDQQGVRKKIRELVKADSPSYLTDDGVKLMNAYASGGYEVLLEYFDDRPRTLETFIRNYHRYLTEISKKRSEVEKHG
jgi:hypothetical protein